MTVVLAASWGEFGAAAAVLVLFSHLFLKDGIMNPRTFVLLRTPAGSCRRSGGRTPAAGWRGPPQYLGQLA